MNRMYRYTRHIYDLTRRPYLLGRDAVLDLIADRNASHVVELGCGTARNLRYLAQRASQHTLYGLDASSAMLNTARAACQKVPNSAPIHLTQGLAQTATLDTFGRSRRFDVVLCSYVLSMIPEAPAAVENALHLLRPGGRLHLVDFWDQAAWPAWCRRVLRMWLRWFGVHHRPRLHAYLDQISTQGHVTLHRRAVAGRYAYQAVLTKSASGC